MTTEPADGRIRLTVLGGDLGSGKTTCQRHHLHLERVVIRLIQDSQVERFVIL